MATFCFVACGPTQIPSAGVLNCANEMGETVWALFLMFDKTSPEEIDRLDSKTGAIQCMGTLPKVLWPRGDLIGYSGGDLGNNVEDFARGV